MMLNRISLKYKIALIVFVLETFMITLVLWRTHTITEGVAENFYDKNIQIYMEILSDLGRIALIEEEYAEFQNSIEKVIKSSQILHIVLADYRGTVVACSDGSSLGKGINEMTKGTTGFWKTRDLVNSEGKVGTIGMEFSENELKKADSKALRNGIIVAFISMLIIAIVGVAVGTVLTKRLQRLEAAALKISEGNLAYQVDIDGDDEVAHLSVAFKTMQKHVSSSIKEAMSQGEKFLKAFNESPLLMTLSEIETGRYIEVNWKFLETGGYTREEVIGKTSVELGWISEDDRNELKDELIETGKVSEKVLNLIRKDGSEVICSFRGEIIEDSGNKLLYSIAEDITDKIKTERELLESRSSFKALVEFTSAIHWELDLVKDSFTYVSPQSESMTGYSPSEWVSMKSWAAMVHPDDRGWAVNYCESQTIENRDHDFTYRLLTKGGEEKWIRDIVKVISETGRPVKLIGVMLDITGQKQVEKKLTSSLEEKKILLKEVHHRVKNNMAIISALLELQTSYLKDPNVTDVFTVTKNRIRAMALVHEKLYDTEDFSKIYFNDYAGSLLEHLSVTFGYDIKIETNISEFYLVPDILIPCGLIINEVVTNGYKHAFSSEDSKKVTITAYRSENGIITLIIRDNGKGLPDDFDKNNGGGLGMLLVSKLIQQLHGTFDVRNDNGAVFRFEFPDRINFSGIS